MAQQKYICGKYLPEYYCPHTDPPIKELITNYLSVKNHKCSRCPDLPIMVLWLKLYRKVFDDKDIVGLMWWVHASILFRYSHKGICPAVIHSKETFMEIKPHYDPDWESWNGSVDYALKLQLLHPTSTQIMAVETLPFKNNHKKSHYALYTHFDKTEETIFFDIDVRSEKVEDDYIQIAKQMNCNLSKIKYHYIGKNDRKGNKNMCMEWCAVLMGTLGYNIQQYDADWVTEEKILEMINGFHRILFKE